MRVIYQYPSDIGIIGLIKVQLKQKAAKGPFDH